MTPTALIIIAIASLLSFALAWFMSRQTQKNLASQMERELDSLQTQLSQTTDQKTELQIELTEQKKNLQEQLDQSRTHLEKETKNLNEQLSQHQIKAGRLEAMLIAERKRDAEKNKEQQDMAQELAGERSARSQSEQRAKELETRLEEQQLQNQKAVAQLQENKDALKQEFKHLAHEIFEARGKVLSQQHHEQLNTLLTPFKEQLGEFRNKIEEAHKEDNLGRAALKQQLETMHQLNRKMTDDAQNLTKALKGDKKLQGNWGEMQVETILDSSGLIKGQEYQREANFKDENGQNQRPDFIVHLPEGKHLIIDSKVSLVDYMAYVNAETDADREATMARHIQSIRNHINSLNQKDYPSLPEIKAPDFVFMFMPIEPAFISAFQYDQQLFNDAFEKRIVVVTPTTLLATLKTVANLWTIERQNANTRKLADKGRQVYDKLRIFVEKMEKLDTQLGNARTTYDDAMGTLKHGRGNLIAQADQFLALGVRVKKELPAKTLETADLEPLEAQELEALEATTEPDKTKQPAKKASKKAKKANKAEELKEQPVEEPPTKTAEPSQESQQSTETPTESADTALSAEEENHTPETEPQTKPEQQELADFSVLESKLSDLENDFAMQENQSTSLEDELARLEQEPSEYQWSEYEKQFRPDDSPNN